jgi:hypothetical protein
MNIGKVQQVEVRATDVDMLLENARQAVAECGARADVLQFMFDEVEGKQIIARMQREAHVLSRVGDVAPDRRREAERLMGDCARIWTGIATAKPWAWR